MLELVFDYGEHDDANPQPNDDNGWPARPDAFSSYRSGFEIRTYRLCKRLLMFHNFIELGTTPCLVKSLDVTYTTGTAFTFLTKITQQGYIRNSDGSYTSKALPPMEFSYQELGWNMQVNQLPAKSLENMPTGIDANYQWIDLYNEGIPGVFSEQAGGWFYKTNSGNGVLDPMQQVAIRPSFNGIAAGKLHFQDIEGRGQQFLVTDDLSGYFELTNNQEWLPFKTFTEIPNIDLHDPNVKMLDLNGDGQVDILISEESVFTWYASKGKEGYDSYSRVPRVFDEEQGPVEMFSDVTQSILIADMSGDGLPDIVRIRNSEVSYWPNLGYGRFGAKVTMENAPVFDTPEAFNPRFLQLADMDGSGTTDIVYLGGDTFQLYFNQSGNSWSTQNIIDGTNPLPFPKIDKSSTINVIDLLGAGTATIVWSSPLPKYSDNPLYYIDLQGGNKPHIMTGYKNNMGKEVQMSYKPSTFFYLQDKQAGTPWITHLPFPVQCVEQVVSIDHVAKTRFTNQYTYHHGYFDHTEREFRGFGRVDQTDTENYENYKKKSDPGGNTQIVDIGFFEPPVLSKTWFHTGAFFDVQNILTQFAHEYYQNAAIPEKQLQDPPLPLGLTTDELREALRACKNIPLRTETYALDKSEKQDIPYATSTNSCLMQLIQPRGQNPYSVWMVQKSESLSYTYERNPADPRITHNMTLETDIYGNILKSANINYGRKNVDTSLAIQEQAEQSKNHILISESGFTNAVITSDDYHLPVPFEGSGWELTGAVPAAGDYYSLTEVGSYFNTATIIPYEEQPTTGIMQKRMLSQIKSLYQKSDLSGALDFGIIQLPVTPYQSYKLALTESLRNNLLGDKVTGDLLLNEGKYVSLNDGNYWIAGGTITLDPDNFYRPTVFTDAFGFSSRAEYDTAYGLFVQQTTDAIGNVNSILGFSYRTISPYLVQDINDNRTGVRTDALGIVSATFVMGKSTEQKGDFMDLTSAESSTADKPGTLLEYDLSVYQNTGKPNFFKTTVLDTHFYDLQNGQSPVAYLSYTYASGSGAVMMQKAQAEPGIALQENGDGTFSSVDTTPAVRWIGSGRTIINNKGYPVKQYDPYFSVTFEFEDSKELVERGVTPIVTYDSIGRAIRTDMPNGTFTKVVFDAWMQTSYDVNDTVKDSQWYIDRITSPVAGIATPEEIDAANKALAHYNTPSVLYLDSLGRTFVGAADNGVNGKYKSVTIFDITGRALNVTDPRENVITQSKYNMLGSALYTNTPEAGERWNITDVAGKPLRAFDSKGNVYRLTYDNAHRPLGTFITPANGIEINTDKTVYGEGLSNDKANNLRGKAYQSFTSSGVSSYNAYDFKGNLLQSSLQFCTSFQTLIDWNQNPAIDSQIFNSSSTFDALNRTVTSITPDKSAYLPTYNQAGKIGNVDVQLRGATTKTDFVKQINYDVKGRPESIIFGNNTKTSSQFDLLTERLKQLLTTGSNGADILQSLNYTYDPIGNITKVQDNAQQTVYFNNGVVSPSNDFTYDAIYRLITASGREHIGQNLPTAPNDPTRVNLPQPGDGSALRSYTQNYQYDAASNILKMIHSAGAGSWTRTYNYEATRNRLVSETVGSTTQSYSYDVHGNIENIAQLNGLSWNVKDELQMADLGGGGKAYYVYTSGQRVRKVIERLDGSKEMRFYMGGFELYRQIDSTGKVQEETETLHVPGAAMVETKTIENGVAKTEQLIRYQYANQLGSAVLETDQSGSIISYEEYHPYGSTAYQAKNAMIKAAAKRYKYTGMERDEETGMQYHTARYYLPWLGRWLSADPIGIQGGLNVYEYAASNPILNSDASGHSPTEHDLENFIHNIITDNNQKGVPDVLGKSGEVTEQLLDKALSDSTITEQQFANYVSTHPTGLKFSDGLKARIAKDVAVPVNRHEQAYADEYGREFIIDDEGRANIADSIKHPSKRAAQNLKTITIVAANTFIPEGVAAYQVAKGIIDKDPGEIAEGAFNLVLGEVLHGVGEAKTGASLVEDEVRLGAVGNGNLHTPTSFNTGAATANIASAGQPVFTVNCGYVTLAYFMDSVSSDIAYVFESEEGLIANTANLGEAFNKLGLGAERPIVFNSRQEVLEFMSKYNEGTEFMIAYKHPPSNIPGQVAGGHVIAGRVTPDGLYFLDFQSEQSLERSIQYGLPKKPEYSVWVRTDPQRVVRPPQIKP